MKRVEVEELLQQMEQFADFLFAQGKVGAGNELLGFIETADAVLEDCELEQEWLPLTNSPYWPTCPPLC